MYIANFNNLITDTEDKDGMKDEEYNGALCAATIIAMAKVEQVQIENCHQT